MAVKPLTLQGLAWLAVIFIVIIGGTMAAGILDHRAGPQPSDDVTAHKAIALQIGRIDGHMGPTGV